MRRAQAILLRIEEQLDEGVLGAARVFAKRSVKGVKQGIKWAAMDAKKEYQRNPEKEAGDKARKKLKTRAMKAVAKDRSKPGGRVPRAVPRPSSGRYRNAGVGRKERIRD